VGDVCAPVPPVPTLVGGIKIEVVENMVLRKIFGSKWEEMTGGSIKLNNE
jgi:hypothetical protein